jgi:uncharacterized peroxidase-related enzyme
MSRLRTIDPDEADGKAGELLDEVRSMLGIVPNILRVMANAPAVLQAYLDFTAALGEGRLSPELRERIALAVSERNGCGYCLAAHSMIGKMRGLTSEEVLASRRAEAADDADRAAVTFAAGLVDRRGEVGDEDVEALRAAGYDDGGVAEIVGNVALTLFSNYFNHVAETDVDFPAVAPLED